jgi:hypothetical protein
MSEQSPQAHVACQIMTDLTPAELVPALRREGVDAIFKQSTHQGAWVWLEGKDDYDCLLMPGGPGEYLLRDGFGERRALEALARGLSSALVRLGIRHRMELYGEDREMFDYLHLDWPLTGASDQAGTRS